MTTFIERSDEMCNDGEDVDCGSTEGWGCGVTYCDICGAGYEYSPEYLRAQDDGVNYEDDED